MNEKDTALEVQGAGFEFWPCPLLCDLDQVTEPFEFISKMRILITPMGFW